MRAFESSERLLKMWLAFSMSEGTGACAAVVAGIREGLLDGSVQVATRGGELTIRWRGGENNLNCAVWMTGPAVAVFEGEIEIES